MSPLQDNLNVQLEPISLRSKLNGNDIEFYEPMGNSLKFYVKNKNKVTEFLNNKALQEFLVKNGANPVRNLRGGDFIIKYEADINILSIGSQSIKNISLDRFSKDYDHQTFLLHFANFIILPTPRNYHIHCNISDDCPSLIYIKIARMPPFGQLADWESSERFQLKIEEEQEKERLEVIAKPILNIKLVTKDVAAIALSYLDIA
jgi:hypothetical protein